VKKHFKKEKDLRLFVKNFLKTSLKGLPEDKKFEVKVKSIKPPCVQIFFPFYSEGNLIRANEVDFLIGKLLEEFQIKAEVIYLDEFEELLAIEEK